MKKVTSGTAKKPEPNKAQAVALAGIELDARGGERRRAVSLLAAGRTPLAVIEVAARANEVAEDALAKARQAQPPPPFACQEGCDWCCYQRVGTAAPEVLRVAEYLRQTLTPDELRATRERVRRLDDERRALTPDRRKAAKQPCALLVGGRCQAYPVRPLTCRGCNSADAAACEASVKQPSRVAIPDYAPQRRLAAFVLDGMRAGLTEAGLKGDLLELVAALRVALETPDAAERWLAGEPVFAPARMN